MGQYNNGRNFVIMGHSQGTVMTTRLLQDLIDGDPELRKRLVAALLIGGSVTVPEGQTVGGTFQNLPLCTTPRADAAASSPTAAMPTATRRRAARTSSDPRAWTPPAPTRRRSAAARRTSAARICRSTSTIPPSTSNPTPNPAIETPFALYRDFYTGECVKDDSNRSYLEIGVDARRRRPARERRPVRSPALRADLPRYARRRLQLRHRRSDRAGRSKGSSEPGKRLADEMGASDTRHPTPITRYQAILFDYGGTLDGPASHWLDRFVELLSRSGSGHSVRPR